LQNNNRLLHKQKLWPNGLHYYYILSWSYNILKAHLYNGLEIQKRLTSLNFMVAHVSFVLLARRRVTSWVRGSSYHASGRFIAINYTCTSLSRTKSKPSNLKEEEKGPFSEQGTWTPALCLLREQWARIPESVVRWILYFYGYIAAREVDFLV
jgi:hypothetical protein